VKVKKKVAEIVPKSRTTLLQGTENDVNIPTLAAASESVIHDKSAKKISDINPQFNESSDIAIMGNSSVIINYLGESCDANKSPIQFGSFSNFVGHHSRKDENIIDTKMKKPVELMPKPRTALFQGGENDEPIAPQDGQGDMSSDNSNIAAGNSLISSDLQFGAILFDEKYGKNMEKFTSAGLSSNILFRGVNCHNKEEEKKKRKYIYIGAMQVNVDD
jgi:hypothetical protein